MILAEHHLADCLQFTEAAKTRDDGCIWCYIVFRSRSVDRILFEKWTSTKNLTHLRHAPGMNHGKIAKLLALTGVPETWKTELRRPQPSGQVLRTHRWTGCHCGPRQQSAQANTAIATNYIICCQTFLLLCLVLSVRRPRLHSLLAFCLWYTF